MNEKEPPSWSISWLWRGAINLLLGKVRLPGWLVIAIAIFIGVPAWSGSFSFWLQVAQSSNGYMSTVAHILLWPFFAPALGLLGLVYVVLVSQPATEPARQHPILPIVGWISFVICFVAIAVTALYGATEFYIREEIAKGIAGVSRGSPDQNLPSHPQRPLESANRNLQPDQIRILLHEFPDLRQFMKVAYIASAPNDNEAWGIGNQYENILIRSGISTQRMNMDPSGPDDEGLLIEIENRNNIPQAAQKFAEALEIANIHPRFVVAKPGLPGLEASTFIFFVAPDPID